MTVFKHELRQGFKSLAIWTMTIGFFIVVCVCLYPEMSGEMDDMGDMFASMGAFSDAFGLDELNFGTLIGYYAIECGNVLGLGGAFFAAITAITTLAKEEKEKTAEFLLTHPVSRIRIVFEKLFAVLAQVVVLNVVVYICSILSMMVIGEEIMWAEITWLHFAYFLVQLVLAGICFGVSAFIRSNGIGIGMGIATTMYFLNIVANITESAKDLKYITPFGFADGADIIANTALDGKMVVVNMVFAIVGVILAFIKYTKKDIH